MDMKPFWLPDRQGFLAIAIISLIATIVITLIIHPISMDDKTFGLLSGIVGVLVGCLKDVYAFDFGSSKGSAAKDETITKAVSTLAAKSEIEPIKEWKTNA